MCRFLGVFARRADFEEARGHLDRLGLGYAVLSADPGYARVGVPALIVDEEARMGLLHRAGEALLASGWVDYRPSALAVPAEAPAEFEQDVVGRVAIMLLTSCVADTSRIRLIAHVSGNLADVFPYLNAEMPQACYSIDGPTLSFMDGYRMVSLYAHRVAIAKADDLVDAWRCLEAIRCRVSETWSRRGTIEPSYQMRARPPALEIYKRLPKTNCRLCGEKTCLAFALRLWNGEVEPGRCRPMFEGPYRHSQEAFLEICRGLGLVEVEDKVPVHQD